MQQPVFHLGLTMAGAVSAGAYTAGVMDCFLEMLEMWERAKQARPDDPLVPQHKVCLEVISGASAGGMTAALTTLGLLSGMEPIASVDQQAAEPNNLLYNAWIRMSDTAKTSTIQQLLDLSDITDSNTVHSLLNSDPIDQIANSAANDLGRMLRNGGLRELPAYVSRDLHILMTLSNLRGVSMGIDFTMDKKGSANPPVHKMSFHKALAHFRLDKTKTINEEYLHFDPTDEGSLKLFLDCAKATGAFPIGLAHRNFTNIPPEYIRKSTERLFRGAGDKELKFDWEDLGEAYHFSAVDGGMTNNEPFGETVKILEGLSERDRTGEQPNYGVVMINPFPDFQQEDDAYRSPEHLLDTLPQLYRTLREQTVFKQADLINAYKGDYSRAMIYPVRREKGEKQENTIACGSLYGFGGFFKRAFREHDFRLGRRNCRDFLNYYFTAPAGASPSKLDREKLHPVHQSWKREAIEKFGIYRNGWYHLPIIPDMSLLEEDILARQGRKPRPEDGQNPYPSISSEEVFALRPLMEQRFHCVLGHGFDYLMKRKPRTPKEDEIRIRRLINRVYRKGPIGRTWAKFQQRLFRALLRSNGKAAAAMISKKLIESALLEFDRKGLLK